MHKDLSNNLKNRGTKRRHKICFPKFGFTTVNPTSPLRKLQRAGSLSTAFLDPLLISSLVEAKSSPSQTSAATHNLGCSSVMPSRLGGFTSKSNKHDDELLVENSSAQDWILSHLHSISQSLNPTHFSSQITH